MEADTFLTSKEDDSLARLKEALERCPTDVGIRCKFASQLEASGRIGEALSEWKKVLAYEANCLMAWEGVSRCHRQILQTRNPAHFEKNKADSPKRSDGTLLQTPPDSNNRAEHEGEA